MNRKRIFISIIIIGIAVIVLVGYRYFFPNTVEKQIVRWANKNCNHIQSCEIKIADITKFDWDTLYYFETGLTQDDVAKIMNVSVDKYTPGHHTIVFLKNNKVVYAEYFPTDIEGYKNNEVVFRGIKDNYGKYDASTVFHIGKNELTSRHYYELEPIRNR